MPNLIKLVILVCGGNIRCAKCGHRINLQTIVGHCRARHPEMMGN